MTVKNKELSENIFSVSGIEVAQAFALIDAELDYCTSMLDLDSESKIFTTRLAGGEEMINSRMESFFDRTDSNIGRAIVRDVKVGTNLGKIDAIAIDVIDFESMNYLQLIYPYQVSGEGDVLQIHRLKLTDVKGMDDDVKRIRMDQFFDGLEGTDSYPVFVQRATDISVDFA